MTAEDLMDLFLPSESTCAVYVHLRDHQNCNDVRHYVNRLWCKYRNRGLLDPDFPVRFASECPSRIWELRLASALEGMGIRLLPPVRAGDGMDFCFSLASGARIWVEATTPSPGAPDSSDRVNAPYNTVIWGSQIDRTISLRYLSAIKNKREQFQRAIKSGAANATDALVVALSGANIPLADVETPGEAPLLVKCLFGIGDTTFIVRVGPGPKPPPRLGNPTPRTRIWKARGAEVEATLFLSQAAAEVSAVVLDPHHVKNCAELRGEAAARDLIVVHNPYARVPITPGLLCGGREFSLVHAGDSRHIVCSDTRKPAPQVDRG